MAKKVALVFGGRSLESDISVITAMQTLAALKETEFIVEPVYLTEGGFYMRGVDDIAAFTPFERDKHLRVILADGVFLSVRRGKLRREFRPDVALICCHGGEGENGVLQGLLEFNGVPYTSAGVTASAVCMDKAASKCVFEQMLLNVLPYVTVRSSDALSDPYAVTLACERTLDYPVIVKPASQGSSIGISAAHDREELAEALAVAARFDDKLVVEEKLTDFVEVNCAAYARGGEVIVSETERPLSAGELLTFEDKYVSGGKMSGGGREMPAPVGDELNALVRTLTERIYRTMELKGVVRVDFLVDRVREKVYINEVNTVPGSMAFYLFEPAGKSFSEVICDIVEDAAERGAARRARPAYSSPVLSFYGRGAHGGKCAP